VITGIDMALDLARARLRDPARDELDRIILVETVR
jgi:hypothetical protein